MNTANVQQDINKKGVFNGIGMGFNKGKRRLLGVVEGRRVKSLLRFFREFGKERCARIKVICSDMWQPYLKVIKKKLPGALNVLDRFHIAKKLGEAVDQVRREEVKSLSKEGYDPILKNARYCFLKRLENLTHIPHALRLEDRINHL